MTDKIIMRTLRYCEYCKKNTYFQYNPLIEHSRCTQCQQSFSKPINDMQMFKEQIISLLKIRLEHLKNNKSTQRIIEVEYLIKKIDEIQYREP